MKPIAEYVQHGRALAGAVARDPRQVRDIPRWLSTLSKSNLALGLPWLPYRVIDRLAGHLGPVSRVFEFGGGGSTLWFADRVGRLITVEHDPAWFELLDSQVGVRPNVELLHRRAQDDYDKYVSAIDAFPDATFDLVVVDGRERVRCIERAMDKVKPGGLLVLDDSDRARYARAHTLMDGWPHQTYTGLTPTKNRPGVTTLWQRPGAEERAGSS